MKTDDLVSLVQGGKKPLVKVLGWVSDDAFVREGMIARVIAVRVCAHDTVVFTFDYNEKRKHNLALDNPSWYLSIDQVEKLGRKMGTAIESGHFEDPNNLVENVGGDFGEDIDVKLVEDNNTPMAEYVKSGSKQTYVEWLEAKLEELVPECMKSWTTMEGFFLPAGVYECPDCHEDIGVLPHTNAKGVSVKCPKCHVHVILKTPKE